MRFIISPIIASFFWLSPLVAQLNTGVDINLINHKADSLLHRAVESHEHVGITAGIYTNKQIIWNKGEGFADRQANETATADMIHRIASISKSMTAVAILQLFEQGKIDLDAPIQTYIPAFPQKPQGKITTRQLLTHTSGIAHYKGFWDGFSFKEYPDLLRAMGRFQKRNLVGKPGEVYQYTTYGYVVLGVIIERVSEMSYEEYMQKHIWEPAGMKSTAVEHKGDSHPDKSALYRITKKGKLKKDMKTNLSMKVPGGGIQSTSHDLLLFGRAIIENRLIKQETLNLMLEDPGIRERGNPYGMGWFLYDKETGNRIIGHSGAQAGTCSQLLIHLDKGIVISVISNTRNQWGKVFQMSWQLMELAGLE